MTKVLCLKRNVCVGHYEQVGKLRSFFRFISSKILQIIDTDMQVSIIGQAMLYTKFTRSHISNTARWQIISNISSSSYCRRNDCEHDCI